MNTILGVLVRNDDTGEVTMLPVSLTDRQPSGGKSGKIVKQPTPDEVTVSKEQAEDFSLDGRLKKHKEVSKEEL